jgi:hypothetical protein
VTDERIPIPGDWECPTCGFVVHKRVLRRDDGEVFVDASARREVCPNDGVTLVQCYEKPDDKLVAMGPCCHDPECLRCGGENLRAVGWHYRDDERVWSFKEEGDR